MPSLSFNIIDFLTCILSGFMTYKFISAYKKIFSKIFLKISKPWEFLETEIPDLVQI
jgi:hypothetical protein